MTTPLAERDPGALQALAKDLAKQWDLVAGNRMSLDLSRGKPAADQLSLSDGMEDAIAGNYRAADGTDVRNYGGAMGLPEARALGAELLGMPAANVMAGGNSSLNLMHLVVSTAVSAGLWQDGRAWSNAKTPKLLTPVPGYDRHFVLSAALGMQMVNIGIGDDGPDMEAARKLAAADPSIKGIWCVPKYSNPTGCTYSDDTVRAMAELPNQAAADDFVVLWDNAYAVHELTYPGDELASLFEATVAAGTADHAVQFASTSKITFAGAGVAFLGASEAVLAALAAQMSFMTIGPDKVNQLRHARFLQGRVAEHMRAHAALLAPKFELVQKTLREELGDLGIAEWTEPRGGYFVSLDLLPGLAKAVIDKAQEVGLTLTPAGATFPHGEDPQDRNVRIAPTFADMADLTEAMQILTLCVKLVTTEHLLAQQSNP